MADADRNMSEGSKGLIPILVALGALVLVTVLVAIWPTPVRGELSDPNAAAMLSLIAAGAIGIERVVEVLWAALGLNGRPWWPFTLIGYRVQDSMNSLNET